MFLSEKSAPLPIRVAGANGDAHASQYPPHHPLDLSQCQCTARKEAQSIYLPVILGVNAFYWLIKYIRGYWLESTLFEIFLAVLFGATHYVVYLQILDQAMNRSARDTSLIGGHWLDVLAVVILIQLSLTYTVKASWLLLLLPLWGGWTLYQTVMGKQGIVGGMTGGSTANTSSSSTGGGSDAAAAPTNRKQRRAEQKKQRK